MSRTTRGILQIQSEIHKILSNPRRLQLLYELRDGEKTVSELSATTGLKVANVSQHLGLMRRRKMLVERRVGNSVFYRIADERINSVCDIVQAMLLSQASDDEKFVRLARRG